MTLTCESVSCGWQSAKRRRPRAAWTPRNFSYCCRLGAWRSARLKRLSLCRDSNGRWRTVDVFDRVRGKLSRQRRRLRHERIGDQEDGRADRTITVLVIVARLLGGQRLHLGFEARDLGLRISAVNAVEMDVPERDGHLQGQRKQRAPRAESSLEKQ